MNQNQHVASGTAVQGYNSHPLLRFKSRVWQIFSNAMQIPAIRKQHYSTQCWGGEPIVEHCVRSPPLPTPHYSDSDENA